MFFRPKGQLSLSTDIHSHLIPGVDDGVRSLEESLNVIRGFQQLGYRRLITTPHISESYYPNGPALLKERHNDLVNYLQQEHMDVTVDLGAEYMVDALLLDTLNKGEELLTWNSHILIETSFHSVPWILDEVIFTLQQRGLIVVLAHPERYPYFFEDQTLLYSLKQKGVRMQLTIGSVIGQYGSVQKKLALKLLNAGMIDFLGSDVHNEGHLYFVKKGLTDKVLRKKVVEDFSNYQLI